MVDNEGPGEGDEARGHGEDEDTQLQVRVHALVNQLRVVDPGPTDTLTILFIKDLIAMLICRC